MGYGGIHTGDAWIPACDKFMGKYAIRLYYNNNREQKSNSRRNV